MPNKLPKGWTWARFDELFQVASDGGRRLAQSRYQPSGKYPVIDQGENDPGGFTDEELVYEGELPVILFGDHTRRFKLVEKPFVVGAQGIKILRPPTELPVRLLWLALTALKIESRGYSRHFQFLRKARLRLAPLGEQKRILEKLDALLSRVTTGEAAARRAQERLKRYRAAVLHAAVTGALTRAWRKANKTTETGAQLLKRLLKARRARWEEAELKRLREVGKPPKDDKWKSRYEEPIAPKTSDIREAPMKWAWASVDQLNPGDRPCTYGVLQPGPHNPRGVPLVRVGDINDGRVTLEGMKRISPRIAAKYQRTKLQGGELLITLVGAIGRTAVVPKSLSGANTARAVGVVPLTALVDPFWVELWFRSPAKLNEMVGKAHEVARKTLNLEDVRSAAVPVPPLPEQSEIVREVQRRLTAADRLTATLNRQLGRARATRQSLLRQAFSGQLVPQDPKDEPASILLDRLRGVRDAEAETTKKRTKSRRSLKAVAAKVIPLLELIKRHYAKRTFTFDSLRGKVRKTDYDTLKNELFALLRPAGSRGVPLVQMEFDAKNETIVFRLPK
jgi:type I restriction enzyme S subunit